MRLTKMCDTKIDTYRELESNSGINSFSCFRQDTSGREYIGMFRDDGKR